MKMTDDDLLSILKTESNAAQTYNQGQLAQDRVQAIRDYMRLPYGTEEVGRSQVIASDVFDAVEGMLPDLIEVFASTDEAVRFDPVGPEDEQSAKEVTDACNYVFYKQNNGFFILYEAAKDALQLKTGGVKWCWELKRTPIFQTYKNVDETGLAAFLATHKGAEVISKEKAEPDPSQPQPPGQVYNVKIKTVEEKGKVRVDTIPPDELIVSTRQSSLLLDDCPYVAHHCKRTMSDITQMGYDVTVEDVKAASGDTAETTADRELRNALINRIFDDDPRTDDAMVEGWLCEEYVLVDFDGDGIAERRRVIRLGDKILENDECSHVQIAAWTPYVLTHQFHGVSVAELVSEFQRASTEIWRQNLDTLQLSTNNETVVLTDQQGAPMAAIDDLLNRKPGGIIREKVAGAVRPYVEQWQGVESGPMVEMMASMKENRTGYTRYSQGLDADSLNKTAHGIQQIMNASQKRMKLMARIMAEALVAPMFKGIFKTLQDYCMDQLVFRLNGKFVQYDPQNWSTGYDMSINVGIGAGDKMQQMTMLGGIEQAQALAVQAGGMGKLVTPKNIYNLQKRKVELAGFKDPNEFWTDPDTVQPQPQQPPPPDPAIVKQQMTGQQDAQKFQAQSQQDAQKTQAEMAFKASESEKDRQFQIALKAFEHRLSQPAIPTEDAPEQKTMQAIAQAMQNMANAFQVLATATMAPKEVIQDENGRPIGVRPVLQ